ncbi:MAG: hypothetical protein R6U46_12965 [Marinilabilia sp.]
MKLINLIYVVSFAMFISCEPVEETYDLGGVLSEEEATQGITIENEKDGNNKILLRNNLEGVGSLWDYGTGTSNFVNDEVILPPGEHDIKFTGLCDGGTVSVTKTVEITSVEYELDEEWTYLCGEPGEGGKTWVWATGNPNMGNGGTSALYGNGPEFMTAPEWWIGDAAELGESGLYDEMHFTYTDVTLIDKEDENTVAEETTGKFSLDNKTTDADGHSIEGLLEVPFYPMGLELDDPEKFPNPYKFELVKLTPDEMTLRLRGGGGGEGWGIIYLLKRKGYEYEN